MTRLGRYVDNYWQWPENFVLRRRNGTCIFLEQAEGTNMTCCLIPRLAGSGCPGLYRRECWEGLVKYWRLVVRPCGQLEGVEEKLSDFYPFLNSLMSSNNLNPKSAV